VLFFEAGGVLFFALFVLWLFALVDCITTPGPLCRNLPKLLWIVIIVLLSSVGAVLWLVAGRPRRRVRSGPADYAQPRRPIAVEDTPRYSATPGVTDRRSAELDRQIDEWEARQRERDGTERDRADEYDE
jgi:phospholipase D-like protein